MSWRIDFGSSLRSTMICSAVQVPMTVQVFLTNTVIGILSNFSSGWCAYFFSRNPQRSFRAGTNSIIVFRKATTLAMTYISWHGMHLFCSWSWCSIINFGDSDFDWPRLARQRADFTKRTNNGYSKYLFGEGPPLAHQDREKGRSPIGGRRARAAG